MGCGSEFQRVGATTENALSLCPVGEGEKICIREQKGRRWDIEEQVKEV